jgi:hypothetical protein
MTSARLRVFHQRNHAVEEGGTGGGDAHLDLIGQNLRAAGEGGAIAASLTEAIPSMTSPSDGMISLASTATMSPTFRLWPTPPHRSSRRVRGAWRRLRCGSAQRVGLRLAAPLGNRFGEAGEEQRESQPRDDLKGLSSERAGAAHIIFIVEAPLFERAGALTKACLPTFRYAARLFPALSVCDTAILRAALRGRIYESGA